MGNLLVQVEISPEILFQVSETARLLGQFEGLRSGVKASLKEKLLIQNVYANLALEGSTLSVEQVKHLLLNKPVGAVHSEVAQAAAFVRCYDRSTQFSIHSMKDLLTAFLLMNEGLSLKSTKVGEGEDWNTHMKEALELLGMLFRYVQEDQWIHPLLKAAIFHYEVIHIRPFVRYSGAVARLWHRLLLREYHPVFAMVPLEYQLKNQQQLYEDVLSEAHGRSGLQKFVRFSLQMTYDALERLLNRMDNGAKSVSERLSFARIHFGDKQITRKKYMELFKTIGPATASRDLKTGLDSGLLEKRGAKARTVYSFVQ